MSTNTKTRIYENVCFWVFRNCERVLISVRILKNVRFYSFKSEWAVIQIHDSSNEFLNFGLTVWKCSCWSLWNTKTNNHSRRRQLDKPWRRRNDDHQTAEDDEESSMNSMGPIHHWLPQKLPMMLLSMTSHRFARNGDDARFIAIGHRAEMIFVVESMNSDTMSSLETRWTPSAAATAAIPRGAEQRQQPPPSPQREEEREGKKAFIADDVAYGQRPRRRPH